MPTLPQSSASHAFLWRSGEPRASTGDLRVAGVYSFHMPIVCPQAFVEPGSPPTSYAVAGVLNGEPGAWGRVAWGVLERSVFIAPGLYLAGVRGKTLATGSLLASASITTWLFALYGIRRREALRTGQRSRVLSPGAG